MKFERGRGDGGLAAFEPLVHIYLSLCFFKHFMLNLIVFDIQVQVAKQKRISIFYWLHTSKMLPFSNHRNALNRSKCNFNIVHDLKSFNC